MGEGEAGRRKREQVIRVELLRHLPGDSEVVAASSSSASALRKKLGEVEAELSRLTRSDSASREYEVENTVREVQRQLAASETLLEQQLSAHDRERERSSQEIDRIRRCMRELEGSLDQAHSRILDRDNTILQLQEEAKLWRAGVSASFGLQGGSHGSLQITSVEQQFEQHGRRMVAVDAERHSELCEAVLQSERELDELRRNFRELQRQMERGSPETGVEAASRKELERSVRVLRIELAEARRNPAGQATIDAAVRRELEEMRAAYQREFAIKEQQLMEARRQCSRTEEELAELRENHERELVVREQGLQSSHQLRIESVQSELLDAREERDRLRRDLEVAEAEVALSASATDSLRTEVHTCRLELRRLNQSQGDLHAVMEQAQSAEAQWQRHAEWSRSEVEETRRSLESRILSLQTELSDCKLAHQSEVHSIRRQLSSSETESSTIRLQLQEMVSKQQQESLVIRQEEEGLDALRAELHEAQRRLHRLQEENCSLRVNFVGAGYRWASRIDPPKFQVTSTEVDTARSGSPDGVEYVTDSLFRMSGGGGGGVYGAMTTSTVSTTRTATQ